MQQSVIAILTDYGTRDGRAAKLIGAVKRAEETLDVCLAVNNFPAGDVPGAAATLHGFLGYFPARTVTAALIGETDGKGRPFPPIAAKAPDGKVFLVPNNGLLTVWEQTHGIAALRRIDAVDCPVGANLYAYTAGLLASGILRFEAVGGEMEPEQLVRFDSAPVRVEAGRVQCGIQSVVAAFGNLNLNITIDRFLESGIRPGDRIQLTVTYGETAVFDGRLRYERTFGCVPEGAPVLFNGSSDFMGLGCNQTSFAGRYLAPLLRKETAMADYAVRIEREEQ